MIRLATGITPNYVPRAQSYLDSLHRHLNVDGTVFLVDFNPFPSWATSLSLTPVNYAEVSPKMPKTMLQNGAFTEWVPEDWSDSDIIIFTDADAILQRPFTCEELERFGNVEEHQLLAGYNWPNEPENLIQEAANLFPKLRMENIAQLFPGADKMACLNCGFLVARLSTWRELLKLNNAITADVDACFDNPARTQFMICYAAQNAGWKMGGLSPATHAHGHIGLKDGLVKGEDGIWRQDGSVVGFAHALS